MARAVLCSHGIGSFDEIYRLQLFAEVTSGSHVRDDDLVRLKVQHPADYVSVCSGKAARIRAGGADR